MVFTELCQLVKFYCFKYSDANAHEKLPDLGLLYNKYT